MTMRRQTPYVSVNLTGPARDKLRHAVLDLTTPVGRRLSMSDTLIQAICVAMQHKTELIAALMSEQDGAA